MNKKEMIKKRLTEMVENEENSLNREIYTQYLNLNSEEEIKELIESMKNNYFIFSYDCLEKFKEHIEDVMDLVNEYQEEGYEFEWSFDNIINSLYCIGAINIEGLLEQIEEEFEE